MKSPLVLLASILLSACASMPFVASAEFGDSFVRSDTNLVVARGASDMTGAILVKGTGLPAFPPVVVPAGKVLLIDRESEEHAVLEPTVPLVLPAKFAVLFSAVDAARLGVVFE